MTESTIETPKKSSFLRRWLKRLLIVLVLVAVLFAVNALYESVLSYTPSLTGEAGDLLYVAAFDGFLDEWELYEGRTSAQVQDDALVISVDVEKRDVWSFSQPQFEDFDVTLKATAIDGPLNNGFGIIYRLQTAAERDCELPMVILCDIGDISPVLDVPIRLAVPKRNSVESINYYKFLISSDGFYSVWQVQNGVDKKLSDWIASPAVHQELDAENTIRVVARGNRFQFFINGEQVQVCIPDDPNAISTYSLAGGGCVQGTMQTILENDTIAYGQIGAIAQTVEGAGGGAGVVVQFDNMTVFSPSNKLGTSESNA